MGFKKTQGLGLGFLNKTYKDLKVDQNVGFQDFYFLLYKLKFILSYFNFFFTYILVFYMNMQQMQPAAQSSAAMM